MVTMICLVQRVFLPTLPCAFSQLHSTVPPSGSSNDSQRTMQNRLDVVGIHVFTIDLVALDDQRVQPWPLYVHVLQFPMRSTSGSSHFLPRHRLQDFFSTPRTCRCSICCSSKPGFEIASSSCSSSSSLTSRKRPSDVCGFLLALCPVCFLIFKLCFALISRALCHQILACINPILTNFFRVFADHLRLLWHPHSLTQVCSSSKKGNNCFLKKSLETSALFHASQQHRPL